MVEYLREHNVEVALFTDHDTVRWDYGFFPSKWLTGRITGWLIGKAFGRSGSVQSFGPEAYVELMEELDTAYKDILVIPGVEAIPFFYWEGSLLFNTLTIHDVYKHLLAFGLEDEGYSGLPSIGEGFQRRIGFRHNPQPMACRAALRRLQGSQTPGQDQPNRRQGPCCHRGGVPPSEFSLCLWDLRPVPRQSGDGTLPGFHR